MQLVANDIELAKAASYLASHDPVLAPIIKRSGICPIRPHKQYYQELVDSIISQQLSVKAATSILKRFVALFDDKFPTPTMILQASFEDLRSVGLSRAKVNYIRDLAQHITSGEVKFDHLDKLSNQAVIQELTDVKGIGEWTAHMFLMFCMGRLDVLAYGDLGIRNGIYKLYDLAEVPTPAQVQAIAEQNHWAPYQTVACWYVWQSLENSPPLAN